MEIENVNLLSHEGGDNRYLSFVLDHQLYAIDAMQVIQIVRDIEYTIMPMMPAYIEGIIELRNEVIIIMDLRKRMGLASENVDTSCVVIISLDDKKVGLIVDEVRDVFNLLEENYEPDNTVMSDNMFIKGLYKEGNSITMVLNTAALLEE